MLTFLKMNVFMSSIAILAESPYGRHRHNNCQYDNFSLKCHFIRVAIPPWSPWVHSKSNPRESIFRRLGEAVWRPSIHPNIAIMDISGMMLTYTVAHIPAQSLIRATSNAWVTRFDLCHLRWTILGPPALRRSPTPSSRRPVVSPLSSRNLGDMPLGKFPRYFLVD